ncbi:MAG: hypothetical protein WC356_04420 [Candidatus Micrarchaeia archaeon]|jgi:hypothetical protein
MVRKEVNPLTGEIIEYFDERPRIELKYGIEFIDKEFGKWCHDFLEIDKETQIDILLNNPEISCAFDIPDQILMKALDKLETNVERLCFLSNVLLDSKTVIKLFTKYKHTKKQEKPDLKEKTREAFKGRLEEIPKEKRVAYVRYE